MTNVMTKAGREQGTRNPACAGQGSGTLPLCTPGAEEEQVVAHPANTTAGRVGAASEERHVEVKIIFRDLKLATFFPESLRKHCLFGGGFC